MRSLMICIAHQFYAVYQIEKNEMGGACSMFEGQVYTGLWWGKLRERDQLEDPNVDGRIILRRIFGDWMLEHGLDRAGSG